MACNPRVEEGCDIPTPKDCPTRLSAHKAESGILKRVPDIQKGNPNPRDITTLWNVELSAQGGFTPPEARLDNYLRNIKFNGSKPRIVGERGTDRADWEGMTP